MIYTNCSACVWTNFQIPQVTFSKDSYLLISTRFLNKALRKFFNILVIYPLEPPDDELWDKLIPCSLPQMEDNKKDDTIRKGLWDDDDDDDVVCVWCEVCVCVSVAVSV